MFRRKKRHKHEWLKWVEVGMVAVTWNGRRIPYIGQERECATCGLKENR